MTRLRLLYRRRWGLFYVPVLALATLAIWVAARYALPLPPTSLTIAAGVPRGGYAQLAEQYRDLLQSRGITTEILGSEGAAGPLRRLADPKDPAQVCFAHGLLSGGANGTAVQALAVIGKQPLWLFTRHNSVLHAGMLGGMKIAAGPPGGALRQVATQLLTHHQLREQDVTWVSSEGLNAANDLLGHRVDAVATIASSDSPTVRLLTRTAGIALLGVERASSMVAREPRLHPFVLPQGAIELRGNVPPRDLTLLYTGTHLLVRPSLHPALQRVLLDTATDLHSAPTFLQLQAEFPDFGTDFPLSPMALRHLNGDRPWAEAVLPYWWAQLAELLLYAVLPILVLTVLALLWIPRFFSLRVDGLLARHYGELSFLENELDAAADRPLALRPLLQQLDRMERELATLDLPDRYADRWYTLREHLVAARARLMKLRGR